MTVKVLCIIPVHSAGEASAPHLEEALRGSRPFPYTRAIICGQASTGKTSLQRSLLDQPFVEDPDSTVGVELNKAVCTAYRQSDNWKFKVEKVEGQQQLMAAKLLEDEALGVQHRPTIAGSDSEDSADDTDDSEDEDIKKKGTETRTGGATRSGNKKTPLGDVKLSTTKKKTTDAGRLLIDEIQRAKAAGMRKLNQDMCFIDIWDFAGQRSFIIVQEMVLSGARCAYFVTFDSSKKLTDIAEDVFTASKEKIFCHSSSPDAMVTNFDVLESWLSTIYHVAGSDVLIVVVGCKADLIKGTALEQQAEMTKMENFIMDNVRDKPYEKCVKSVIFVNNKLSGTGDVDSGITQLQRLLIRKIFKQASLQTPIPLSWLTFTMTLRSLADKHAVLSKEEVTTIARETCGARTESEVDEILLFHHQLGHLMHYRIGDLANQVIIRVQWILQVVSALLSPFAATFDKRRVKSSFRKCYRWMVNDGVLLEKFACQLWKQHKDSDVSDLHQNKDKRKFVFSLLEQFSILVASGQRISPDDQMRPSHSFWLPSLVTQVDRSAKRIGLNRSEPIIFVCDNTASFPHSLFWRLVVACIKAWKPSHIPDFYVDSARIIFQEIFWVELELFQRGIKLSVDHEIAAIPVGKDPTALLSLEVACEEALRDVEHHLSDLTASAAQFLRWSLGAVCRCEENERQCSRHTVPSCSNSNCQHFIAPVEVDRVPRCPVKHKAQDLTEFLHYWLQGVEVCL